MREGLSYSEAGKLGAEKSKERIEKLRLLRIEAYNKHPRTCKFCNANLSYEDRHKQFCNSVCAATYNNKHRTYKIGEDKRTKILKCSKCGKDTEANIRAGSVTCVECGTPKKYSLLNKVCEECGAEFKTVLLERSKCKKCSGYSGNCLCCGLSISYDKIYCNTECQHKHEWNKKKEDIEKTGIVDGKGRRYLIEKFGHKCQICNRTEWEGKEIPLVKDHIDGNSENNRIENLRMICCNCDALTSTFKGRNRGNGRVSRMIRYYEGKSF